MSDTMIISLDPHNSHIQVAWKCDLTQWVHHSPSHPSRIEGSGWEILYFFLGSQKENQNTEEIEEKMET